MTVDDLMDYYIDDYVEVYSLEDDEIVFKGSKYDDDYDEYAFCVISSFEFENDYIVINI